MQAVAALNIQLANPLVLSAADIAALAPTKADVNTFLGSLSLANTTQAGHVTQTSSFSDALTLAVGNTCTALYAMLGLCINKFAATPTVIEPIFDLQSIRNHKQLIYTGALTGNETENILQHTFSSADELKLESGLTAIQFYLSASAADTAANQTLITVNANSIITVTAAQFVNPAPAAGQPIANTFLHVVNTEAAAGSYKVSLL